MATEGWSSRQDKNGVTWYCEWEGSERGQWYKWEYGEKELPKKVYGEPDW